MVECAKRAFCPFALPQLRGFDHRQFTCIRVPCKIELYEYSFRREAGRGGGQLRRIFSKFRNESCTCIEIGEKGMTEEASVPL